MEETPDERKRSLMNFILPGNCFQTNHPYFEGNGVQGLANLMASPDNYDFFGREGDLMR